MSERDGPRHRREPKLDIETRDSARDLRADPRDRPGTPVGRRKPQRIEPELQASVKSRSRDEESPVEQQDRATRKRAPARTTRGRRGGSDDRKGRRPARSLMGRLAYWTVVLSVWGLIGLAGVFAYYGMKLPPIDQLAVPKRPPNIAILADDGSLIANRGDTGGPAIRLSDMPPYLPAAFIAIEDRRFYSHFGVDPIGIGRAVLRNIFRRGGVEGGSTLTQQLAKNLFLTQERTLSRKIQEAILALWLEHRYSKKQILELYLNRVYFGSGAYGVEAAARKYFGHGARQVSLAEAAELAGLMKAPTKLAPNRNPTGAAERAAQVIDAMVQDGSITPALAKLALANPAQPVNERGAGSVNYVADYVMDVLDETVGAIDEDIVVSTTLNAGMQAAAERALGDELNRLGSKFGVEQGALVAMDPGGEIKAMVGGRNYAESQFNRAVAARRQPGSAFKPFVYLTALEHGRTPASVVEDAPINVRGWQPENSTRQYYGPVSLTQGLAFSLNTVAVRLALDVGPKAVVATAHRLGIGSELQPNASIALGTSEVTPLELVSAYVPFANGGIGVQPHIIQKVRTSDGKPLYTRRGASNGRMIEPQYVAMMDTMMQETLITGTAKKAELPGWQAAGKTGTSQDYRDGWFVGYTSQLVAGVWVGNDDASPTKKASGANLPVEIWSRFMRDSLKNVPPSPLPGGVWQPPPAFPTLPWLSGNPAETPVASNEPMELPPARATAPAAPTTRPAPAGSMRPPSGNAPVADLMPPGSIPQSPGSASRAPQVRARDDRNFFEKLFGG